MPNQLINETSPYLLQHAHNPVNWFPWGTDALNKAREENKPIFLSIGYAACHWCHVMEHESFENPGIAELLNNYFVSIKVDREERPDLDSIYMTAVTTMTGQGGWPMSVFLTPDMEPFYGGTYFPPTRRYGMPGFGEILNAIIQSWDKDSKEMRRVGHDLAMHLQQANAWDAHANTNIRPTTLTQASQVLLNTYDWNYGGWGRAPRFPQPMAIEFMLLQATRGVDKAIESASHALDLMSRGGLYDVVGGGFHRYSTDDHWLVPHFEKMLYDNAQLASAYLHAYLLTENKSFYRVCTETLDFITREMTHPQGGFFSSLDADSEGEEGIFYTWTFSEIHQALPVAQDVEFLFQVYPVAPIGNVEGKIILQRQETTDSLLSHLGMSEGELDAKIAGILHKLFTFRSQRIRPSTDDKVLVSWNALTLRAFAEAARYLKRDDYLEIARKNANFLLDKLYFQARLFRAWRSGQIKNNAYLEDYAGLILGLLELYQSDPDIRWYQAANSLAADMIENFSDPQGGFFDTRKDHGELIIRPKDIQDNATPSGNALAISALLRLASFSERTDWWTISENMLSTIQNYLVQHPLAFSYWLQNLDFISGPVRQVAVIGPQTHPQTQSMLEAIWHTYQPRIVCASTNTPTASSVPGLLEGKKMIQEIPTVYICEGFTCNRPLNQLKELIEEMGSAK